LEHSATHFGDEHIAEAKMEAAARPHLLHGPWLGRYVSTSGVTSAIRHRLMAYPSTVQRLL